MKRAIYGKLLEWKEDADRKPLILKGVRQCGKTYILKEFGEKEYDHTAYFSFEGNTRLSEIFKPDLNPRRIINELLLEYMLVGGMPEAVRSWSEHRDVKKLRKI